MLTTTNSNAEVSENSHTYRGHGKLLLSSEYFVLKGAEALALPLKLGQNLNVQYEKSYHPHLHWVSYDSDGKIWFDAKYEFWHFKCLNEVVGPEHEFLGELLKAARKLNSHFLREDNKVTVKTYLDFPLEWGLGSSSTLIYNLASWAYVAPFELLFKTLGGSGYDIACAQSNGPIVYQYSDQGPTWKTVEFNPAFSKQLYFVYLGNKQNSREAIEKFESKYEEDNSQIEHMNQLTRNMVEASDCKEFNELICEHEKIVSEVLGCETIKQSRFSDYWGEIKSLGAWGGDFVLVTSDRDFEETKAYFNNRGLNEVYRYDDFVLGREGTFVREKSYVH